MKKPYSRRDEFLDIAEDISSTLSDINEKMNYLIQIYETEVNEESDSSDDFDDE